MSELNALNSTVEEIIAGSNACNDSSFTALSLTRFFYLRVFEVGNESFKNVKEVKLIDLSKLERVLIGKNSFTKCKNGWPTNDPNRRFYLKNCERLRELKIGPDSFSDYSVCEIENVDSLEVIEMGKLNEKSRNFYYASLELKSDCERMELMTRLAQFEITSVWWWCI